MNATGPRETAMTLGERLITEIDARGHRGRYFDSQGYQTLHGVDSPEALRAFLDAQGFAPVTVSDDLAEVAKHLALLRPGLRDMPLVTLGIGTALGILAFAFAMLLVPATAQSQEEVNSLLAQNLAVIVPLLLGFWYGLVRQSLQAILWGVTVGAALAGVLRSLCIHNLHPATVGPLVLGGLMPLALAPQRPWRRGAAQRFLRGLAVALGAMLIGYTLGGFVAWNVRHVAATLAGPVVVKPTLLEYRLVLSILALLLSPWAGVVLVYFHWAIGLRHPLRGPCLALGLSSEHTPGFGPVVGESGDVCQTVSRRIQRKEAWDAIYRRIRREDAEFRRRRRRYLWIELALSVPVFVSVVLSFVAPRLFGEPLPYWGEVARACSQVFSTVYCLLLIQLYGAAQQQFRNASVAAELQKYPEGTTLEAIQAGTAAKRPTSRSGERPEV